MVDQVAVKISATVSGRITFASQQNSVPLIRDLSVTNDTSADLNDLILEYSASPEFVTGHSWHLDRLRAGTTTHITDRDVTLNGAMLMALTEAITGEAKFKLRQDDECLCAVQYSIEVLARHEWGGIHHMPELLGAFCMPNDAAIDKLLKDAAQVLRRAGKADIVDGYKSGSRRRVWEIASAIWAAISGLGLDYALPPASFETNGQKIRLPSMIVDSGRATCLDITLLFAAALEQAGLNPIVVFTRGHAFPGVWLQPEEFSSLAVDDASALRKRIELQELIVFESTLVTEKSAAVSLSAAIERGKRQISEEAEDSFQVAVDIRRARMQRIRPLPAPGEVPEGAVGETVSTVSFGLEEAPALRDFDGPEETIEPEVESPKSRLDRWQRKLLDLSLRNRLLNFKPTKKSIALFCPDPAKLEDVLADGKKIRIVPAPDMIDEAGGRSGEIHQARTGEQLDEAYAEAALERGEVIARFGTKELESRLIELYRTARNDLQEGGANTLFLGIGFLKWKKSENDTRSYRAPLIMVPVTLHRRSARSPVRMSIHEDEPRFNTTLLEMLRQDFKLDIRGFDEELPKDDSGVDVPGIWRKVREEIRDAEGFELVEDVVLGHFSFAKYLMWKDLVDRTEHLLASDVVRHLMESPRDPFPSEVVYPDKTRLDEDVKPSDLFTPLPADSSQLAAVLASARGKDFVLIGPPGTGKSQTIANMIAHNIAEGRKVLFVSEKIAALNAVYRRLKEVNLAEFCLEIHSNKAKKLDVIQQLGSAWDARAELDEKEWMRLTSQLESDRNALNLFVSSLHKTYKNGLTPYSAMGRVIADGEGCPIEISWASKNQHDREELDQLRMIAHDIELHGKEIGSLSETCFSFVSETHWSPTWQSSIVAALQLFSNAVSAAISAKSKLHEVLGIGIDNKTRDQLLALAELASSLPLAHGKNVTFAFAANANDVFQALDDGANKVDEYRKTERRLSVRYAPEAWRGMRLAELASRWSAAATWWPRSMFLKSGIAKDMRLQGGANSKPECGRDLPILATLSALGGEIEQHGTVACVANCWRGLDTESETAIEHTKIARQMRSATAVLGDDIESLSAVRDAIRRLLVDGNELLAGDAAVGRACKVYVEAMSDLARNLEDFASVAGTNPASITVPDADSGDWLSEMKVAVDDLQSRQSELNSWCAWQDELVPPCWTGWQRS